MVISAIHDFPASDRTKGKVAAGQELEDSESMRELVRGVIPRPLHTR